MTKDEALDLALEALERMKRFGNTFGYRSWEQNPYEQVCEAITAIKQARALDKKAENARELGLDYEPVPWSQALESVWAEPDDTPPAQPAPVQERTDYAVHLNHCNIGEYAGVCKYGDDDCPALKHADMKAKWDRPTPPAAPVQEPVKQRAYEMALRQWEHWKQYALELQEKLVKYEGGAPMVLNTTPPAAQRPWVGLTDEEIERMGLSNYTKVVRETEAKLRSKNT